MLSLMRTEEVAKKLGLKKNTIDLWRTTGQGPTFLKLGRAVRYRPEDIDDFIQRSARENTCGEQR